MSHPQSIHHLLESQAQQVAEQVAIHAPDRSPLTYGRLYAHATQVVAQLNSMGIGRQDRVAVVLPNGPEIAVSFLSVATGATCAPLNPNYRAKEFDFYLSDLDVKAVIVQADLASPAREVAHEKGIPVLELTPLREEAAGLFGLSINRDSATAVEASVGAGEAVEAMAAAQPTFARPEDVALMLHTSGTTSRPKMVPLTQINLCTSAFNVRQALALNASDRCLNVMPLFHIHGLIGVLLSSMATGSRVICTPGFAATQFFPWIDALQPTWYSAVPTMHQAILARSEFHPEVSLDSIRLIRSSSASLPPQVMKDLETLFDTPVIEAYGMTEASHQMASNPLPPQPRKPGSVGLAAGPEVAIMDEAGLFLPTGEIGEVVIRGANVTAGYASNPTANQKAFTDGWFRTGDEGYLDADGYLFLKGRLKEIINRGGEKISPREVDEVLLDHPAVAQVLTFAMPHEQLGEEVGVAVVLQAQMSVTTEELQAFAAEQLANFKLPRKVVFLDEIPKGPTGKLQRIGLAEKLGITAADTGGHDAIASTSTPVVAPRTPVETVVAGIWSEVLALEEIGIHNTFASLGGQSLEATRIVTAVQETFQVQLSLVSALSQTPTIAEMTAVLLEKSGEPSRIEALAQLVIEVSQLSEQEAEALMDSSNS